MKLKDLETIFKALHSLGDFMEAHTGGDESGIGDEMSEQYNESVKLLDDEKARIYLRNAKARIKRERK